MTTLEKLEELVYVGFKQTEERFKDIEDRFKDVEDRFKDTDRLFRETSEELRRDFAKTRKEVANVTDALGRFSENMVAPALVRLLNKAGIPISETAVRVQSPLRRIEYDIVAVNGDIVVVVSVKTRLNVEHVKTFVEERLTMFKEVFPRYRQMTLFGAVAGMSIEQEADAFAIKNDLFVLTQSGDNIKLLNPEGFLPKAF